MFCSKCGKETVESAVFCSGCGAGLTGGQPVKKKHLSTAAGIVDIVLGGFSAVSITLVMALAIIMVGGIPAYIVVIVLSFAAMGLLAVVGGICALRRKHWGIALAGAIVLAAASSLLGIAAVVLTVMAKDEFERKPPSLYAPSPPTSQSPPSCAVE